MIEITIYKVYHSDEREARKLLPLIQKSDVWSPEQAFQTEEGARKYEESWALMLGSDISRTKFNRHLNEISKETDSGAHKKKIVDYMFRNKIIWYDVERFQDIRKLEEARTLTELGRFMHIEGRKLIRDGNLEKGISQVWESENLLYQSDMIRDENIGRNLKYAERNIRRISSSLGDYIKLGISIGSTHEPEKYTEVPLNVVDMFDEGYFHMRINELIKKGAYLKDVFPELKGMIERDPQRLKFQ